MGLVQAGFLGALGALAIPIIVHLVFGRRARRVDLGTLRFLRIALQENVRRRRLKRWLLLAMRLACIVLLALLFARPYLLADKPSSNERLVVILLDRSASMGLKTDRGRLLDLAVAEAQKIVAKCGSGTQLEMACFDHAVHPLGGPEDGRTGDGQATQSPKELLAALESSEPAYGSTDYGAAMAWAHDICVQSDCGRKELHLITDMQRSGLDRTDAPAMPADVEVHLVDLGQPYPKNVAVTRLAAEKLSVRPGETNSLDATLLSAGQFPLEKVPVILYLRNGTRQQNVRREVDLDAGATATVRFDLPALSEGLWQGVVMAEVDDELAFDNRRHVAVRAAPPPRVMLLDGEPGNSAPAAETYYLSVALRLAADEESSPETPFEPETTDVADGAALPDLTATDLVVLANVESVSAADAGRLAQFVFGGGGLLVFGGENVRAEGYDSFEKAGISVGKILGPQRSGAMPWRIDQWDRANPIFFPFNDPQYADLRRPAMRCRTGLEPAPGTDVLAQFGDAKPALVERHHGRGTMLWFLSACDRDWSDLPRSRLYVPLMHQMLGHLAGLTEGGPVRNVFLDDVDRAAEHRPSPGVVQHDKYCEVINFRGIESETDRCSAGELAGRFQCVVDSGEEKAAGRSVTRVAATAELRENEVWHWVLLMLLGVLMLESFLGNRTTL